MKIAIMWENFEFGGVTTHLKYLINDKKFKNYKFTIFTNKNNKAAPILKKAISNKNVSFQYYNSINVIFFDNFFLKIIYFLLRPVLFFISIIQFYSILKKFNFDILLCECGGYGDFRSEISSILASSLLKFQVRILLIHHSFSKPILWNFLLRIIDLAVKKNIDALIFVSKATKKNIYKNTFLYSAKLKEKVIYNGVDVDSKTKKNKKVNKIFKDNYFLKLGMLSRVEQNKGHEILIDVFNELPMEIKKKVKIYFIGMVSREYLNKLKNKISRYGLEKNFKFTGYIDIESQIILRKLDLLISLTRDFEGFGLSLAESLSVGTPVIATRVGGSVEFLNKQNSILIKPNNKKELKVSLMKFIKNPLKFKKHRLAGKRLINKKFSSKNMSQNYKNFFIMCKKLKNKNLRNV